MKYNIIIIGAGTAGLSAGIYAVRAGKKVLVLEASHYGGQIINTPEVENYPAVKKISGFEFASNLYQQAEMLGVEVRYEEVVRITKDRQVYTETECYDCDSIIIATGAKNRLLGVEKEKLLTGKGVSYCATCDGAFFRGKIVAVVGGGNTALEDAGFLSDYCEKIYLIHRRETFRGEEQLVERLKVKENVEFIFKHEVVDLLGNDRLEGIILYNKETGERRELEVAGLFVAIGQVPNTKLFKDVIDMDDLGYIRGGEDCRTNVEGIYVAGDCRTKKVRQLTTAASDGAVAALEACSR